MNFKLTDIVDFKKASSDLQNKDYRRLDRPTEVDCEYEKSLIDKYSNWKAKKLRSSTFVSRVFVNKNTENILLADSMENDDEERIEILMAICEGISRDQAKNLLEVANYNIEEAESYYKSDLKQTSFVKITFVTPNWPEFSQSYSSDSLIWEIGKDLFMKTSNQSEFKITIEETGQIINFETLMTTTFSQMNLKGSYRFKVNFF